MNKLFSRETTLFDYFSVFYKRKWMILAIFLTITAITIIWSLNINPVYEATSKIWYEESTQNILSQRYYYYWNPNALITEQEIILSKTLAYITTGILKRGFHTEPAIWGQKFITELKFYKDVVPGKYKIKFLKDKKFVIFSPEDKLLRTGRIGESVNITGLELTIDKPSVVAGEEFELIIENVHSLANQLRSKLNVRTEKNKNLIIVTIRGNNPELISEEVNTYAEEYIKYSYQLEQIQASETTKFIEEQISRIEDDLINIEDEIRNFKEREKILEIGTSSSNLQNRINNLEALKTSKEI
jgi:uncharacterized protein involved in exopolysaccharide biosynthesis